MKTTQNKLLSLLTNAKELTSFDYVFIMNDCFISTCDSIQSFNDLNHQAYIESTNSNTFKLYSNSDQTSLNLLSLSIQHILDQQPQFETILQQVLNHQINETKFNDFIIEEHLELNDYSLYRIVPRDNVDLDLLMHVIHTLVENNDYVFFYNGSILYLKNQPTTEFSHVLFELCTIDAMASVDIYQSLHIDTLSYQALLNAIQYLTILEESTSLSHTTDHLHFPHSNCLAECIASLPLNTLPMLIGNDVLLTTEELQTFHIYVQNNLNLAKTSRALYIHRNTLVYRLEKIKNETHFDVFTFKGCLDLYITLYIQTRMQHN